MPTCIGCGAGNPPSASHCQECGSPLGGEEAGRESRRTVTILFCDVAGFTSLAETTSLHFGPIHARIGPFVAPAGSSWIRALPSMAEDHRT